MGSGAFAQNSETLDLNTAISLAVKNNYNILLAKDSLSISRNNNTYGNAGALPIISMGAGANVESNQVKQVLLGGTKEVNGVISRNYVGDIALSYTLFNGFKPYATKARFNQLVKQGEINVKIQLESIIEQVMRAYYNLITAEKSLKVIKETISIDDERIKIAETKFKIGSGSKIDLLQAKVDRNQQQSQLLSQQISIDSAKIFLNQIMVRDPNLPFRLADTDIIIDFNPSLEKLLDSADMNNFVLKTAKTNIQIQTIASKERKADLFPVLQGFAGYYYSNSENANYYPALGNALLNRNIGPEIGLNLSWNIFNGKFYSIRYKNAKVLIDRAQLNYRNQLSLVHANLIYQFQSFQNFMNALKLEEENVLLARENFNIALKKYRLGASTQLDLITAVQSLESSLNRLVQAKFNAKISEINLLQLSGSLVH